jgi:hypothetical protein
LAYILPVKPDLIRHPERQGRGTALDSRLRGNDENDPEHLDSDSIFSKAHFLTIALKEGYCSSGFFLDVSVLT